LPGTVLVAVLVAFGLISAATLAAVYQLANQNGRLLLRLDHLERRLGRDDPSGDDGASRAHLLPALTTLTESRIERNGLHAGADAPLFELPGLDGQTVSLRAYRGRRVLLVFSDPRCGPCEQLAPHLVRLQMEHATNGLSVVMIGRGDARENREKARQYGFKFPVALQRRWEVSKQYGIFATPVAFLIHEDGVIARDVGKGVNEILALVS